ncbi:hypothetical protein TRICI_005508 [Trichomonascus ciferrii]|uniref:Uncharacterized protein n=1 Tax=Trichomonascus ciferrii TaxID=44093 RepID=A0A642UYK7_9ASCO|nr:hypothetical protein TRICI_005508 [Trichomonascus ciferrii]
MTEVSSLHNNASGRTTPLAESLSGLHLEQEWKKCDNRNPDDLTSSFDAEAERQNTVTVDCSQELQSLESVLVEAIKKKHSPGEEIILEIVNCPSDRKDEVEAILQREEVRRPSDISFDGNGYHYTIIMVQSDGHRHLVEAIVNVLIRIFGHSPDYRIVMEDPGKLMEYSAISDIGISSSFRKNYYTNGLPGTYSGSRCPSTIVEVAWSQSMNNVQAKVERWHHDTKFQCEMSLIFCLNFQSMTLKVRLLDFTFRSLVQVAHEASASFDTENRIKFFKCLRYKAEEQRNLTLDFQTCLITMENCSSFEDFRMAYRKLDEEWAWEIYEVYSSDVESYLNDATDYLLEITGTMYEMPGMLSPDARRDWESSQNEEANMDDFEKCLQLMSGKVSQSFDLNMSDFLSDTWLEVGLVTRALRGHDIGAEGYAMLNKDFLRSLYCRALKDYVATLWRLPISYTDLTSEGLKWHMNLRGLEARPGEGDQDMVDRLRVYDRHSESVEGNADTILVSCLDGGELRAPRPIGKIGNLLYMIVRSCEQVKKDKLRLMAGVIEDNGDDKNLFEEVVRATGRKTWNGIDLDYRP